MFECWTFEELLPVLRVCVLWRQIALDNPAYWSELKLYSTTNAAVALFLLRLSRTRARPIFVRLDVRQPEVIVSTAVLPAIGRHVDHIRWLFLHFHSSHFIAAADAVRAPAPLLFALRFELAMTADDYDRPELPLDIFANEAPLLESVSLRNVRLPNERINVFSNVSSVGFGGNGINLPRIDMQPLPKQFPNMTQLTLLGSPDILGIDCRYLDWLALLRSLTVLRRGEPVDHAIQHLPLPRISRVKVFAADSRQADTLIEHLSGPLHLSAEDLHLECIDTFVLHFNDPQVLWRRSFTEDAGHWASYPPPHNIISRADIAARLISLTVPNTYWRLLQPFFGPFPNLLQLRFVLEHSALEDLCNSGCVQCPRLRSIVFRCEFDAVALHRTHLAMIARTVCAEARLPLDLSLENTVLQGACDEFSASFSDISYASLKDWRCVVFFRLIAVSAATSYALV